MKGLSSYSWQFISCYRKLYDLCILGGLLFCVTNTHEVFMLYSQMLLTKTTSTVHFKIGGIE